MTELRKTKNARNGKQLTTEQLSRETGISTEMLRTRIKEALKNRQDEINTIIERVKVFKRSKTIILKPEAIEYFKLNYRKIFQSEFKSKIEEYYLKGIDAETAAKELNKSKFTIRKYYTFIKNKVPISDRRIKDPEDFVGKRFGNILITKNLGVLNKGKGFDKRRKQNYITKSRYYMCKCIKCGFEKKVTISNIGRIGCKICGSVNPDSKSRHPLYSIWSAIVAVNYKKLNGVRVPKNSNSFPICERWLSNFFDFAKDIGDRPSPKHVFARIDRSKGYSPDNCKWMTNKERRKYRKYYYELTITNLAKQVHISSERIRQVANDALMKNDHELNKLIERVVYINSNKHIVFKPEAIEYFKLGKYKKTFYTYKSRETAKLYYLQGKDIKEVSALMNKPIDSIKRYYKIFNAEKTKNK